MDERQIYPTFHYSSAVSSSSFGEAENTLQIPVFCETSSSPIIPKQERCENSINDRFESEMWRPTMPTTTLFYPAVGSTASHSATFTPTNTDTDNKTSTSNQPMIRENSIDKCGVIIKEEKILDDEIGDNHCFEFMRPYEYHSNSQQSSLSNEANITTMSHQIHINPSILLSKHRANHSGPGTPMPKLSNDYDYSHQLSNCTKAIKIPVVAPKKRKRSRKKICTDDNRKELEINECFSSVHPKDFAKLVLKVQAKDHCGSKRKKKCSKEKMEMNPMFNDYKKKKVDARLWLNAKAKLMEQAQADITRSFSSSSSPSGTAKSSDFAPQLNCRQFIDRATSPINFPTDEQTIKSNTRDIALSPIRFIEPQPKHYRSHPDVASRMNLSLASSETIESANRTKILNCLLESRHSCGKCIVMSRQMVEPICPICQAKNGGILKKSI